MQVIKENRVEVRTEDNTKEKLIVSQSLVWKVHNFFLIRINIHCRKLWKG